MCLSYKALSESVDTDSIEQLYIQAWLVSVARSYKQRLIRTMTFALYYALLQPSNAGLLWVAVFQLIHQVFDIPNTLWLYVRLEILSTLGALPLVLSVWRQVCMWQSHVSVDWRRFLGFWWATSHCYEHTHNSSRLWLSWTSSIDALAGDYAVLWYFDVSLFHWIACIFMYTLVVRVDIILCILKGWMVWNVNKSIPQFSWEVAILTVQ